MIMKTKRKVSNGAVSNLTNEVLSMSVPVRFIMLNKSFAIIFEIYRFMMSASKITPRTNAYFLIGLLKKTWFQKSFILNFEFYFNTGFGFSWRHRCKSYFVTFSF